MGDQFMLSRAPKPPQLLAAHEERRLSRVGELNARSRLALELCRTAPARPL